MDTKELLSVIDKTDNIVLIFRGLPGSGKSTIRKILIKKFFLSKTIAVHSTDDKFLVKINLLRKIWNLLRIKFLNQKIIIDDPENNIEYVFNPKKLDYAHKKTQKDFVQSLKNRINLVIVDNTNIQVEHFKFYAIEGKKFGYRVISLNFISSSIDEHVKRNIHNVPKDVIVRLHKIYSHTINKTEYLDDSVIDYSENYRRIFNTEDKRL